MKPGEYRRWYIAEKKRRIRAKATVINNHGGQCACCGETEMAFLTIDHLRGDGAEHRRAVSNSRTGHMFYVKAQRMGYIDGLQVLCANCHTAKSAAGVCIHRVREGRLIQSFQTIVIGGHLGSDAEMRFTQEGVQVARFSVAVGWRRPSKEDKDVWEDRTSWYSCSLRGPRAESQAARLTKGTAVVVTGRLQPDIWFDRNNEARLDLNVFAFDVVIADRSERQESDDGERPARPSRQEPAAARQERQSRQEVNDLDDLPF